MKKLALSVILGASLIVTSTAFGLEAMSDSNMKSATGQAGVTIAIDDVTLYQKVGTTVYRDIDGLAGAADDGAGISITGAETLTTIRAIFDGAGDRGGFLQNDYTDMMNGTGIYARIGTDHNGDPISATLSDAALTIDVARKAQIMTAGKKFNVDHTYGLSGTSTTAAALQLATVQKVYGVYCYEQVAGGADPSTLPTFEQFAFTDPSDPSLGYTAAADAGSLLALEKATNGTITTFTDFETLYNDFAVSGVVIGLPTIEICKNGSTKTIGMTVDTTDSGEAFNNGKSFITVKKSDSTLAILGGTLEIVAH